MRILALDPATQCGFAYGTLETLVAGSWKLKEARDSGGMRLLEFKRLLNTLADHEFELVVSERPGGQHKGAIIVQSELQGVLKLWCENRKIPYCAFSSTEVKKYATGKGNAKKPDMLGAAIHKFGMDCGTDDNAADALAIWHLAFATYGEGGIPPEPAKTKPKPKPRKRKDKAKADA